MPAIKAKTVDEYIQSAPEEAQEKLREIRALLQEIVPSASEEMKWGNPAFVGKRIYFTYSAHKAHLNFIPTRTTIDAFKEELSEYTTGRDSVQFPLDKPLPKVFIKKLAEYRIKEVNQDNSLWMHNDKEGK
jgi:uncharacterized protein YdhG (YjbR/CyaY superfamily)